MGKQRVLDNPVIGMMIFSMGVTHIEPEPYWDFTHRDYRPDHTPTPTTPGIPLGPIHPSKAAKMLCKPARKHAPNKNVSLAGGGKVGSRGGGRPAGGKK